MERKISWHLYIGAFIVTSILFGAGFIIGNSMQKQVYSTLENDITEINENMRDVELLILSQETNYFCDIYQNKLPDLDKDTYSLGQKLEYMESEKGVSDKKMKSDYFELEFRDYILFQKAKEQCNISSPILIFLYKNPDCQECISQGYEITKLRDAYSKQGKMIRTYTYDGTLNESIISKSIVKEHNINKYPTTILITNTTKIMPGYHSVEEMEKELG